MSSTESPIVAVTLPIAVLCAALFGLLVAGPRASWAENVLEFPFPEVIGPAQQASATLLAAASTALGAMRLAETGQHR